MDPSGRCRHCLKVFSQIAHLLGEKAMRAALNSVTSLERKIRPWRDYSMFSMEN
jgi:hypothetical protein